MAAEFELLFRCLLMLFCRVDMTIGEVMLLRADTDWLVVSESNQCRALSTVTSSLSLGPCGWLLVLLFMR